MTSFEAPDHRDLPLAQRGYHSIVQAIIDAARKESGNQSLPPFSDVIRRKLEQIFPEMERGFFDDKI